MKKLVLVCLFAAGCTVLPQVQVQGKVPLAGVKVGRGKVKISSFIKVRVDAWVRLSSATSGVTVESKGAADVPEMITHVFDNGIPAGQPVDVVFVVDATGSMHDDIDAVKNDMRRILAHLRQRNPDYRVGVVTYRDLKDDFVTRTVLQLSTNDTEIHSAISAIEVDGGGDWREHVYAGIDTALDGQHWRPHASQHLILMGDAPPHEDYHHDPRNYHSVTAKAQTYPARVHIHTIGIRCDKSCEKALASGK